MSKLWTRGCVDLSVDAGVIKLKKGNTFEPDEAEVILDELLFESKRCKLVVDKWSVYVPSIKLAAETKTLSPTAVAGAYKKHNNVVLMANLYGNPFLLIAEPSSKKPSTAKESTARKVVRRTKRK